MDEKSAHHRWTLANTATHTVTHTRKKHTETVETSSSGQFSFGAEMLKNGPKGPFLMLQLRFVISRSGVRVRLPAPKARQLKQVHMGDFPSGQRGQTVNLLAMPSVVRIHHPPPKHLISSGIRCFSYFFSNSVRMKNSLANREQLHSTIGMMSQCPPCEGAHSGVDPHRDPHAERARKDETAPERIFASPVLFV